ncbi:putative protein OS=Tsukamurella paurometabola (strain ATCC 8368 / DSM / CCUG 35730 /CIP 100753 / JCM 10117 / KCTC 9821 / NBRC 16120 / NCIMB 702349/ NCTC 13040) OX=521096 GN=Tpau_0714 PE=4 SV=1 [Tsukamurella paurometabola]|uniref:Uncharacterized protein n=1 Tax=Tsukamurella paurometabola (strain ATCC 8368 / DSM 20162 / CCUG 35730 / CIP 100753 / JCM 10117 / KCTC 9821 / NBRC 16120 / NCIMB 702349 / NCTC 13040) TaxID=521096 RepID=D5UT64_TSUPD|nr:hypothetical protein [Tsukamurella paurometabola]ADG77351.1 hypothetical protein Tpau_0714 [Tsukamurella paurometabola DSM 20162]SUP26600.1 Uncharacterised protein [Tsukamurella paurometabola]
MTDASTAETQQIPVQRPESAPAPHPAQQSDSGDAAAMRTLAFKAIGLVIGLAMLVGCGFAVEHLTEWGQRWTMPAVFVAFVLVMLIASQLVVGGFSAIWAAVRNGRS